MNRTRFLFIGVLALALGAILSSAVYRSLQARTTPAPPGVDVVIAADDIQVGAKVQDHDVKVVRLPADNLPDGVFHSLRGESGPVGRGVILPISKGEFILTNKLAAPNAGAGLPALIPPGMRAVSVRVNEVVSVAGFVVPGTRVDVLLTGNPAGGEPQTTTVLANVEVLASGQRLERNSSGETSMAPVITLLLSPEDAQKLTLASSEGRIQLSLRNPLDTAQEKIPGVQQRSLYGAPPQAPATPKVSSHRQINTGPKITPPSSYSVEVFKGTKKEDVKFDDADKGK